MAPSGTATVIVTAPSTIQSPHNRAYVGATVSHRMITDPAAPPRRRRCIRPLRLGYPHQVRSRRHDLRCNENPLKLDMAPAIPPMPRNGVPVAAAEDAHGRPIHSGGHRVREGVPTKISTANGSGSRTNGPAGSTLGPPRPTRTGRESTPTWPRRSCSGSRPWLGGVITVD